MERGSQIQASLEEIKEMLRERVWPARHSG